MNESKHIESRKKPKEEKVELKFREYATLGQRKYDLLDEEGNIRFRISSVKHELMNLWADYEEKGTKFNKQELLGPGFTYSDEANAPAFVINEYRGLEEMRVAGLRERIEYALRRANLEDRKLSLRESDKAFTFKLEDGELDKLAENTSEKVLKYIELGL